MRDRDIRWKRAKPSRHVYLRAMLHGHLIGLLILLVAVVVMATWR